MIHKQQDTANTYNIDITSSNVKKTTVASVQDGGFSSHTWGQDRIEFVLKVTLLFALITSSRDFISLIS